MQDVANIEYIIETGNETIDKHKTSGNEDSGRGIKIKQENRDRNRKQKRNQ